MRLSEPAPRVLRTMRNDAPPEVSNGERLQRSQNLETRGHAPGQPRGHAQSVPRRTLGLARTRRQLRAGPEEAAVSKKAGSQPARQTLTSRASLPSLPMFVRWHRLGGNGGDHFGACQVGCELTWSCRVRPGGRRSSPVHPGDRPGVHPSCPVRPGVRPS